jgi:N-methylhydantoinase B
MPNQITVAVIASALRATVWEMSEALRRSSHSPIIREMLDYSCALFTPEGEIVAQDDLLPAFLGAMSQTVTHVIEEASKYDQLTDGDAFMANDPHKGGTHTPDIQVFAPIVVDGKVIAWSGTIAHHADVGGPNPGTEGFANRSIFEEGVVIPPLRYIEDGVVNESMLRLIENNIRDPRATRGDLRAQLAALRLGQRRTHDLIDRYGTETVSVAMTEILDQAERRISAAIAERPDGTGFAEGWLDDDGNGSDPVRIAATVEVKGGRVSVDLTGTDPQMESGLNMSKTACTAAIMYAIKATFDPEASHTSAPLRVIDMHLPEGSMANPRFPAAVSLRHLAALRLCDVMLRALGDLYPDSVVGGTFVGFSSLAAECKHPRYGHPTVIQDDLGGGMGAHSAGDGLSAVDVHLGNLIMLPAEMCEMEYPIRIVCTELVPDSGGPGEFRGGLGLKRVYEFLDDADGVFYTEQTRSTFAPAGVVGGSPGQPAKMSVERADGEVIPVTKIRIAMGKGDRLITITGGGGGYGDPLRRSHDLVARDVREGKVSARVAAEVYGLPETYDLSLADGALSA